MDIFLMSGLKEHTRYTGEIEVQVLVTHHAGTGALFVFFFSLTLICA